MPFLGALMPLLPALLTMGAEMFRFASTEQGQKVVADMLADKERTRKLFAEWGEQLKQLRDALPKGDVQP